MLLINAIAIFTDSTSNKHCLLQSFLSFPQAPLFLRAKVVHFVTKPIYPAFAKNKQTISDSGFLTFSPSHLIKIRMHESTSNDLSPTLMTVHIKEKRSSLPLKIMLKPLKTCVKNGLEL